MSVFVKFSKGIEGCNTSAIAILFKRNETITVEEGRDCEWWPSARTVKMGLTENAPRTHITSDGKRVLVKCPTFLAIIHEFTHAEEAFRLQFKDPKSYDENRPTFLHPAISNVRELWAIFVTNAARYQYAGNTSVPYRFSHWSPEMLDLFFADGKFLLKRIIKDDINERRDALPAYKKEIIKQLIKNPNLVKHFHSEYYLIFLWSASNHLVSTKRVRKSMNG